MFEIDFLSQKELRRLSRKDLLTILLEKNEELEKTKAELEARQREITEREEKFTREVLSAISEIKEAVSEMKGPADSGSDSGRRSEEISNAESQI